MSPTPTVQISIRVPLEVRERLELIAKAQERSVPFLVGKYVLAGLQQAEGLTPPTKAKAKR